MSIIQSVRCPNCGSFAERLYLPLLAQVQTECGSCDYLLNSCTRTGKVIEAYYPGLSYQELSKSLNSANRFTKLLKVNFTKVFATNL